jgi:hypothetical protein
MNNEKTEAGLEALAGRGSTLPAKASSPPDYSFFGSDAI